MHCAEMQHQGRFCAPDLFWVYAHILLLPFQGGEMGWGHGYVQCTCVCSMHFTMQAIIIPFAALQFLGRAEFASNHVLLELRQIIN